MENTKLLYVLKHLPGQHNQLDHGRKSAGSATSSGLRAMQSFAKSYQNKFTGMTDYDSAEDAKQLIRDASPTGDKVLTDTYRWFFNGTDEDLAGIENSVGQAADGDVALRNSMDSVLNGTADEPTVKAIGAIYAYTQQAYKENDIASVDIHRGLRLPNADLAKLSVGNDLDVGSIGHWTDAEDTASDYAWHGDGEIERQSDSGVILHRTVNTKDVLVSYEFEATMHPDFSDAAYENEREIVPITPKPIAITRVEDIQDENSGEMVRHVWLQ